MAERVELEGDAKALADAMAIEREIGRRLAETLERASRLLESKDAVRGSLAQILASYHGGAAVIVVPIDPLQRGVVAVETFSQDADLLVLAARVLHAAMQVRSDVVTVAMPDGCGPQERFELYAVIEDMVREMQRRPGSVDSVVQWKSVQTPNRPSDAT